jgi:uncharacterized protein (TIGR02246 family)
MKISLVVTLVGLAISLTTSTFAQQTVDPKIDQQIRALASNYDSAFNKQDAPAVVALYTEDAVLKTPNGTFNGRQAIEGLYEHYFRDDHSKNVLTVVNKLDSTSGDEVRATGTWSDTFEEAGTIHADGNYAWVLVHEGDTWRIRKSIFDITIHRQ